MKQLMALLIASNREEFRVRVLEVVLAANACIARLRLTQVTLHSMHMNEAFLNE